MSSDSEVLELEFAMPLLSITEETPQQLAICDYDPEYYEPDFYFPEYGYNYNETVHGDDHWDPAEMAEPVWQSTDVATGLARWRCSECEGMTVRQCCYYCGWVICWPCHMLGKCFRVSCKCPVWYTPPRADVDVDGGTIYAGCISPEAYNVAKMVVQHTVIALPDIPEDQRPEVPESGPVLPMTICRLKLGQRSSRNGTVRVCGFTPDTIVLVGIVDKVWWVGKTRNIILNDASGRLHVRFPHNSGAAIMGPLRGRYIVIAGRARMEWSCGGWDFDAENARRIVSADEVSYHVIEACHSLLSLQRLRDLTDVEETANVAVAAEAAERVRPAARDLSINHATSSESPADISRLHQPDSSTQRP